MATSSELPCPGFDSDAGASTTCTVNGLTIPGAPPGPATNYAGIPAPAVAVLLKQDGAGAFRDVLGRDWTAATAFTLPDEDVFAIDATSLATTATYLHVGTTLFDMAVNPKSGAVYVSNTEARNDLRFEGPGDLRRRDARGPPGRVAHHRPRRQRHEHHRDPAQPEQAHRLLRAPRPRRRRRAQPGHADQPRRHARTAPRCTSPPSAPRRSASSRPRPSRPTPSTRPPPAPATSPVTGGGPGGLALERSNKRLYVTTRFDDGLSVIDLTTGKETAHLQLRTAEPTAVTAGRRFLYDATVSSSRTARRPAPAATCSATTTTWSGISAAPDGDVTVTPITIKLAGRRRRVGSTVNGSGDPTDLHPNKGPMTTQTLRGTVNHGPHALAGRPRLRLLRHRHAHRAAVRLGARLQELHRRLQLACSVSGSQFSATDMQTFADFALAIVMPPNPVRAHRQLARPPRRPAGSSYFLGCTDNDSVSGKPATCTNGVPDGNGHFSDGVGFPGFGFACQGCHVLDPSKGFFGTDGESSFENLPQIVKIPQLRNLYDKVGMFGAPDVRLTNAEDNGPTGPQVRGSGFEHDGSVDTLFRFLQANVFDGDTGSNVGFVGGDPERRNVEQWLLAFDSDLAPVVGQQVTLRADNAAAVGARIDLLETRAVTPFVSKILGPSPMECDLVARAVVNGAAVAYRLQADRSFVSASGVATTDAAVRALATTPGQEVTFTCMPPGWLE